MAPDVFLFSSENIYTLLIFLVTLKSVLMKRAKKQMDLELIQIFLFSIKRVRCENLYS